MYFQKGDPENLKQLLGEDQGEYFCPQERGRIKSPKKAGREGGSYNSSYINPVLLRVVPGHLSAGTMCDPNCDSMSGHNKHVQKPVGKQKSNLYPAWDTA